jgi:hypothetical protein
MKTRIAAAIFAVAIMLTPACEQHRWEVTRTLFQSHGHHGEGGHGEHGKAEGDHGHGAEKKADAHGTEAHGAAAPHGEKKAAH